MAGKEVLDESLDDLIVRIGGSVVPHSELEQRKTQAIRKIVDQLRDSLKENSDSANRLSRVLIVLNIIIGIATIAGVFIALCHR